MNRSSIVNPSIQSSNWYLDGFVGNPPILCRIAVSARPFRIGRQPDMALCLPSGSVSKAHAEIFEKRGKLWIRDLESRNGTFVNGNRISRDEVLNMGDVLHFANLEFRLGFQAELHPEMTMHVDRSEWTLSLSQFEKLFEPGAAIPFFQPIVSLIDDELHGHEVLARSEVEGLSHPARIFDAAQRLRLEGQVSALFRREGVDVGQQLPGAAHLFLNTHPAELGTPALMKSLRGLRQQAPSQPLVLEIHEAAITNLASMRELRSVLDDLDMRLAYDDFGAGQARLVDLIEVPPHYLKFDISLVRDIDRASDARLHTLETLVRMAHDLGVAVLAEGIESSAEAQVCRQLGFEYVQGYHFGRPAPISHYTAASLVETRSL